MNESNPFYWCFETNNAPHHVAACLPAAPTAAVNYINGCRQRATRNACLGLAGAAVAFAAACIPHNPLNIFFYLPLSAVSLCVSRDEVQNARALKRMAAQVRPSA